MHNVASILWIAIIVFICIVVYQEFVPDDKKQFLSKNYLGDLYHSMIYSQSLPGRHHPMTKDNTLNSILNDSLRQALNTTLEDIIDHSTNHTANGTSSDVVSIIVLPVTSPATPIPEPKLASILYSRLLNSTVATWIAHLSPAAVIFAVLFFGWDFLQKPPKTSRFSNVINSTSKSWKAFSGWFK